MKERIWFIVIVTCCVAVFTMGRYSKSIHHVPAAVAETTGEVIPPVVTGVPPIETVSNPAADRDGRKLACEREINAALKRHDCTLAAAVMISARGNEPVIYVIPNRETPKEEPKQ